MTAKKTPVVFYSWQSDLPNKTNRAFVEEALKKACNELNADLEEADRVRLDADVQGEAGSPDIAATILGKIEAATVVVADVSIIGVAAIEGMAPSDGRPVPNPNVMFELGYAKMALGSKRVLMVCNTAYGAIEDLPFDIRGKSVLGYRYKADGEEKPAGPRNDLAARIKAKLETALAAAAADDVQGGGVDEVQAAKDQEARIEQLRERMNENVLSSPPVPLVDGPIMVVRLIPALSLDGQQRVDPRASYEPLLNEMAPYEASGWNSFHDTDSITAAPGDGVRPVLSFTTLFETGIVEAVVVPVRSLNVVAHAAVTELQKIAPAPAKLGLSGRCFVTLDVLRSKGAAIDTEPGRYFRDSTGRPIGKDRLAPRSASKDDLQPADATILLKPAVDFIWRAAGFDRCWYIDERGKWVG